MVPVDLRKEESKLKSIFGKDKEHNNQKLSLKEKFRKLKNLGESEEFQFVQLKNKVATSSLFSHSVQLIRSTGTWSMGLYEDIVENSILLAYLELIKNSKHFIYIENQFFISSTAGKPIQNTIVEALVRRIKRAIEEGERFMVVIVIPLLPGFEGGIEDKNANIMRITLGYQQYTISRGEHSVFAE